MRATLLVAPLVLIVFCPASLLASVVRVLGPAQNTAILFSDPGSPHVSTLQPGSDMGVWTYDDARSFEQSATAINSTSEAVTISHWVDAESKLSGFFNHTRAASITDMMVRIDPSSGESIGDSVDLYLHTVGLFPVGPTLTSNASVFPSASGPGAGRDSPNFGTLKFSAPIGVELRLLVRSDVQTLFQQASRRNGVTYQLSFSAAQPSVPPATIPEPSSVMLGLLGAAVAGGLAVYRRRSRSESA